MECIKLPCTECLIKPVCIAKMNDKYTSFLYITNFMHEILHSEYAFEMMIKTCKCSLLEKYVKHNLPNEPAPNTVYEPIYTKLMENLESLFPNCGFDRDVSNYSRFYFNSNHYSRRDIEDVWR